MIKFFRELGFVEVASELKLNITRKTLPTSGQCPICRANAIRLYRDMATGGAFFECRGCKRSGDMIDLLQLVWRMDESAVLYKLRHLGLTKLDAFGVQDVLRFRGRFKKSLEKSDRVRTACLEPGLTDVNTTESLLARMHVRLDCRFHGSKEYCPKIFGVATPRKLLAAIRNVEAPRNEYEEWKNFRRPGIVVPFYDLPGRISSLVYIDREHGASVPTESRLYLKYDTYQEDGIAMHPDVTNLQVFPTLVTVDTLLAVRLWAQCSQQHYFKLPLVCATENTTAWSILGRRNFTVIASNPYDVQAVHLAIRTNAHLFISRVDMRDPEKLKRLRMADFHGKVKKAALPWHEAVANHLNRLAAHEIDGYLDALKLNSEELDILKSCKKDNVERLIASYARRKNEFVTISHRGGIIQLLGDSLIYSSERNRSQIANAAVKITKIVKYGDLAIGIVEVHTKDKSMEFQIPYEDLTKDFFDVLHTECLKHDFVFVVPHHWKRQLHSIVLQLHTPEIVNNTAFIGYSESKKAWYTPSHKISHRRIAIRPSLPAWLSLPGIMHASWKHRDKLTDIPTSTLVALILATRQLAHDSQQQVREPVFFSGVGSMFDVQHLIDALNPAERHDDMHKWLIIPRDFNTRGRLANDRDIELSFLHGYWLYTTDVQRCYGAFRGGVSFVNHNQITTTVDERKLLAAIFIQFLKLWDREQDVIEHCLAQLQSLGRTISQQEFNKYAVTDVDACYAFTLLLKEIDQSRRKIWFGSESTKPSSLQISPDKLKIFVPASIVEREMRILKLGAFEYLAIFRRLSTSKQFHGFDTQQGVAGWYLDRKLVESVFQDQNLRAESMGLRVVS